ncbi:hypothetical protein BT69DRAFT_1338567 [Atractiella rhizophila]|nr:hypothetical protein BT69DRAFT_1338567 [Atractiella rhizophila]
MERSSKATYLVSVTLLDWPAFESSTKRWSGLVPPSCAGREDVAGHFFFGVWIWTPWKRKEVGWKRGFSWLDNPHFVKPEMVMELDDVMFRDWEVEPGVGDGPH